MATVDDVRAERIPGRMRLAVAGDYLLSHLGFFTVSPVLAAVLTASPAPNAELYVGIALFCFAFAMRGASLFLVSALRHLRYRTAMAAGLGVAAVAFLLLGLVTEPLPAIPLLLAAGCGINMNGLMARVYITDSLRAKSNRHRMFTLIQITVNVSAAVGPFIGNLLLEVEPLYLFGVISVCYGFAALVTFGLVPGSLRPDAAAIRSPLRWTTIRSIAMHPRVRLTVGMAILGGFLYAQLFSGISLHVIDTVDNSALRATVFAANAVLVVAVQIPVTALVARWLDREVNPVSVMAIGIGLFCAAFAVMGLAGAWFAGLIAMIVVFSVGETFFTPTMDTAFTAFDNELSSMELVNLRLISNTIGESTGSFIGVSVFLAAVGSGLGSLYWYGLGAIGAALALILTARSRSAAAASREAM
ncbi:MFS transporter [Glycomyces xiaoerkulensis]|uniref:MFS transporter n=1 Tax=Glycomyces xiaoerkulensis TaxID=2038139 RepID=UPI000C261229|nr:MFS transporter [Glycomyces xiaoerkulensis]